MCICTHAYAYIHICMCIYTHTSPLPCKVMGNLIQEKTFARVALQRKFKAFSLILQSTERRHRDRSPHKIQKESIFTALFNLIY